MRAVPAPRTLSIAIATTNSTSPGASSATSVQDLPDHVDLLLDQVEVRVGHARQRDREPDQRAVTTRLVLREHVQHSARLRRHRLRERFDATVLEMEDAIGDVEDAAVVRHQHDAGRLFSGELLNQVRDVAPRFPIERRRRLVGEDDLGVVDQRARDRHALTLAAAELVDSTR
jgi:hypothetical protein